jgi:hypothetical protein
MFITPAALELALLWPFSLGGDDDRPWTAESTLESGSVMMGRLDMCVVGVELLKHRKTVSKRGV